MRQGFWNRSLRYIIITLGLMASITLCPLAMGDGADAELNQVEVSASPSSQGVGGIILLDAAVSFYGGCCYHLYANDVTAILSAPDGIDILSGPTPKRYDEVDAQPGGTATVVHFKWSVRGTQTGYYNLSVLVGTDNCGSLESTVTVDVVEGCIITSPIWYPSQPVPNRDNMIQVEASTSLEGRYVEEVTLFYIMGEIHNSGEPVNDTLYVGDQSKHAMAIPMERDPFISEEWTCKLRPESAGHLNLWFVARDDTGENTTSSLFVREVQDQEAIDAITSTVFWMLILACIVGFIVIYLVQGFYDEKQVGKRNILCHQDIRVETGGNVRKMVILGLLVLSIILIVFAVIFGMLAEIAELALG
jgi:hypothetical protein